jgi:carbon monoxide dehydrogenase subunit G
VDKLIRITGSYLFEISRENVWQHFLDPDFLLEIIPGCESLEYNDEGVYHGNIRIGVPGLSGNYLTRICTVEADPPRFCRYEGEVRRNNGCITGNAEIFLSEESDKCQIDYRAKGIITGALSKINSRFIAGIAHALIRHGISNFERKIIAENNLD